MQNPSTRGGVRGGRDERKRSEKERKEGLGGEERGGELAVLALCIPSRRNKSEKEEPLEIHSDFRYHFHILK